jgi:hypothetical protein
MLYNYGRASCGIQRIVIDLNWILIAHLSNSLPHRSRVLKFISIQTATRTINPLALLAQKHRQQTASFIHFAFLPLCLPFFGFFSSRKKPQDLKTIKRNILEMFNEEISLRFMMSSEIYVCVSFLQRLTRNVKFSWIRHFVTYLSLVDEADESPLEFFGEFPAIKTTLSKLKFFGLSNQAWRMRINRMFPSLSVIIVSSRLLIYFRDDFDAQSCEAFNSILS